MRKFIRLLAIVGLGGAAGMLILGGVFSNGTVAIGGLVVLLVCAAGVIICNTIVGYNPVDDQSDRSPWHL